MVHRTSNGTYLIYTGDKEIHGVDACVLAAFRTECLGTAGTALVDRKDGQVAERLPELAGRIEFADQITLRMLPQHRSGIPNYTDHDTFDWSRPPSDVDVGLALVLDTPADFKPDADYRYSNTNYLLIGRMLDRVLGYSHRRYIQEEVLAPLGLSNTYGLLGQVDLNDVLNDAEQAIYSSVYEYGHKGWLLGYQSIARYHEDADAVVIQVVNTTGGDSELVALVVYDRIVRMLLSARQAL